MRDYKKCCVVCGIEKEKEELASLLGLKMNICLICEKLKFEEIVAGVRANHIIPQRVKQKWLSAIQRTPMGRKFVNKAQRDIEKGRYG